MPSGLRPGGAAGTQHISGTSALSTLSGSTASVVATRAGQALMPWMLPSSTSMTSHAAHWVGPFRQFTDTTWRAACNALVGPKLEVEPGERCLRCLDYLARRGDDD